ncbi:hypothetical protein GSI_09310 [Ganoderma sinense ZZ0214-1]|uniref:Uncharacterized protein n=1 Tax=Ganoderma sinense ZZ0214-1 TaxID=1077348 RepID=A0A2G8S657_9APHY|nr:hypothetical protein GSI_09310 [Ganoderma sinense ZZ0214-1]
MRDVLTGLCRQRHRGPRSSSSIEDVYTFVDNLFASETGGRPDYADALLQYIGNTLDGPAQHLNEVKPPPGFEDPSCGVILHSIPDSDFSVRLFPGDPAEQVHCLDFVRNDTGYPVNSPFDFELWAASAWPCSPCSRVFSIEESVGLAPESILPGEEIFALRDRGYTCLLKRKEHKDLVFTVPVRRRLVDGPSNRRMVRCATLPCGSRV